VVDVAWLVALTRGAFAVDASCADRVAIDRALHDLGRLEAAVGGQRIVLAKALRRVSMAPESDLAAAMGIDRREAKKSLERARLTDRAAGFAEAMSRGEIRPEHTDRLGAALGRLDLGQAEVLLGDPGLVDAARGRTPEEFDRELRRREREITADHGEGLFARQQREVRLRNWVDDDGMSQWKLSLDPLTGARFAAKIRAATEAVFHSGVPDNAPSMPRDLHQFLQAQALLGMVFGDGPKSRSGRPEITVVVDTRVPAGARPVIDWGIPVELPDSVLADLATDADVHTVVVDGDQLVSAPGPLDLGRSSRLASPAQRRALRALYATCAVPGCCTRFDHLVIHHIDHWGHDGLTNLNRLLPVCVRHHTELHQQHWRIDLEPGTRRLTIGLPGGRTLHGHPNRIDDTTRQTGGP